ncbi:MAG: ABC transporter ATP-binding protein [Mucilaginibacter sp.]|uniref:ABC transporter ATP-binding protein n=1 Tax=Mucilaginibacter sp. TaxID=1882438 RepID=UPI0034E609BF
MSTVIKVENLSKVYRLGEVGTGTISRDLERWLAKVRGKEDPFLTVGEVNDRTKKGSSDVVWSLKDVSFDIKHGEAVGIIGGNGAGKSTLLKLLSRVTAPTSGTIKVKGKIASLLEVGTGFNPELTGRENIYLNGAILGMRKKDIARHFDEIVDFSGVERYIDTPVKRYSSGMYVRLAFAVAAHLETDIMIIDEVLAVGDAEFQKKCMGKMSEVSSEQGRTILFVSHNINAIKKLCSKAIWLDKGRVYADGNVNVVANQYMGAIQQKAPKQKFYTIKEAPGNDLIKVLSVELVPYLPNPAAAIDIRTALTIKFRFYNFSNQVMLSTDLMLYTLLGECIFSIPSQPMVFNEGMLEGECTIPGNLLNDGSYFITILFVKDTSVYLYKHESCLFFDVADYRENENRIDKWPGFVRPALPLVLKPSETNDEL